MSDTKISREYTINTNSADGTLGALTKSNSNYQFEFKDGELVHMLERHHIEGRSAKMISQNLMGAYNEHC